MKRAFSIIEVVFVIVILGIVASISSQIIVQVYDNYITQKAIYKVSTKTEIVANQIVNRLTYAIEESAIIKTDSFKNNPTHTEGVDWKKMNDINDTDNFAIVEWIGYDNDSFSAGATPYWSGVSDYETATKSIFDSPASQLGKVDEIIKKLSNNQVSLNSIQHPAIVFQPITGGTQIDGECMGLINNDRSCIYAVSENNATSFHFDNTTSPKIITERYQLAWSAYTLVPEKKTNGLYDLYLHYNYQPWEGEHYYDNNTSKSLMLTNMSVFKFTQNGGSIQFKICATENIGADYNISTCKEKAIIR